MLRETIKEIEKLLILKNSKYGDSFYKSLDKYNEAALIIRLEDKMNRADTLIFQGEKETADERLIDTIADIAGYCLLYLTYKMEKQNVDNKRG